MRDAKPTSSARPPRFSVKFNNGAWKVFDRASFSDVSRELRRKEADEHAAQLNAPRARR